ncbi:hypothetical protein [Luteibacter sp.]|uniref:hypothetical protein n=1 Tax=Luteibacter sp. TaxID=1886636 RepID=UPI00280AAF90|nr:hypothetical protein [Luteibacter sp.]
MSSPALAAQNVSRDLPAPIAGDLGERLTVAQFLRGMQALSKLGPYKAEKNRDYVAAIRGLARIAETYRVDYGKAKDAGTTLDSCPIGSATMSTDTLMVFLQRLAPEQRTMPMEWAFREHMRELYPCAGQNQ